MKKKLLITFAIIGLIAYLLGNIVPIKAFVPNVDWNRQISSGELFYYFINTIQAIGTVGAVIIALFSDNIKSYFRKPELDISLHSNDLMDNYLSISFVTSNAISELSKMQKKTNDKVVICNDI